MLILSQADVNRLLSIGACIDVMAAALASLARGDAVLPLRTVILIPQSTDAFAVMPGFLGTPKTIGAKIITVWPGNHGTEFDSHQGAVLLFDPDNGSLSALLDATAITTVRTAAVSAVATRLLARENASKLAMIGSGVQAHAHLEAMCAVRPIRSLRVWSRNTEHSRTLVSAAQERFELDAEVAPTGEDAVRDADIVCTVTSARQPVLNGAWLAPGTHINAIGASQASARELDSAAVVRSRLYVDRRESALKEPGDILVPLHDGEIEPEHIVAEIGELLIGRGEGRRDDSEITLFKSLGLAVEDLASAQYVYAEALRVGAGVHVELGGARHAAH
jgi:ornithine cyclodeaminase/alanine dehydrogenase-like protein (mu-crystallin family)